MGEQEKLRIQAKTGCLMLLIPRSPQFFSYPIPQNA